MNPLLLTIRAFSENIQTDSVNDNVIILITRISFPVHDEVVVVAYTKNLQDHVVG